LLDGQARFKHLKLKIAQWVVAGDATILQPDRKEEFLGRIEFSFHFLITGRTNGLNSSVNLSVQNLEKPVFRKQSIKPIEVRPQA
jgi:hypothetical protein